MFIIVLGKHVSILIESSSSPSKKDPYSEDDSIRIETCCPNTIISIINVLMCLTDTSFYIYILLRNYCTAYLFPYPQPSFELTDIFL